MKTCAFITVGCKVNQYETQGIREQFLGQGFAEVSPKEQADFYIINSCTVTHQADSDCRRYARKCRKLNPKAKIILTGCYANRDAKSLKDLGCIDYIVPNEDKQKIIKIIFEKSGAEEFQITSFKGHDRAFVKVQDGCNNYCSYCIVPYVRGRSRSRDLEKIVKEVRVLVANGFKEIVLCGVCLGNFGKDKNTSLLELLKSLVAIPEQFRIRLSSIEPKDVTDRLIRFIAENNKICNHLHIPVQSGDDEMLRLMNRPVKSKQLIDLAKKLYKNIPDVCLTTDIIIGLPKETKQVFRNTINLLKEFRPLRTHIFTYSRREGTKLAGLKQDTPHKIIKDRRKKLEVLAQKLSLQVRRSFIGKTLQVLIESSKDRQGFFAGYTNNYIRVQLKPAKNLKKKSLILAKVKTVKPQHTIVIPVNH